MTTLVRQRRKMDCGIACVAMAAGVPYETAAALFPADRMTQGFTDAALLDALWRLGYAAVSLFRVDQLAEAQNGRRPYRAPWPPEGLPFPRILLLRRRGHYVVEASPGIVLDPAYQAPMRWNAWSEASSVIAPAQLGP